MTEQKKIIRCAIYTRKSVTEGLEQEFNSLDEVAWKFGQLIGSC